MESRFGAEFGQVRVHTDPHAAQSARQLGALAYTIGSDVYFGAGRYRPGTGPGRRLLAHELTHVLQQRGAAGGTPSAGSVDAGDDRFERQAEQQAARVVAGQSVSPTSRQERLIVARVQRQGVPPAGGPTAAQQPPGPPLTTTSCTPAQASEIANRLGEARRWVNDAESKIQQFRAGTAPTPLAWTVHVALQDNFHTTDPADVATIAANFASLKAAINGNPSFECVTQDWCDPRHFAYVRGRWAWMRKLRDINICPKYFACTNPLTRVTALIHERAHQYPGAWDYAYCFDPEYATLSPATAIDNTDSYAITVRQIFHGGLYGPATGHPC